jgi:heme/copper-type cytochrome/quinol oxidase subunit 2
MKYIVLIVLGYVLLKFCGKILRKVCSAEATALWLAVLFCWLILDWFWVGAILLAWRYILIPVAKYQERHPKQYKRNDYGGTNWSKVILWAIPIFWPILIARMFLSGKTYKPTMNEYDYEQFQKGNGK